MEKQYSKVPEYKVKNYNPTIKDYKSKMADPKTTDYKPRDPPKLEVDYTKPVKVLPSKPIDTKYKEYVPAWSKGPQQRKATVKRTPMKAKNEVLLPMFSSLGSVRRTMYIFHGAEDETK